jgi:two-component system, chemotaxis family, protein-glutamate methylesterase/glutaminase
MNEARIKRDVIVIGASTGGVQALHSLCARLPSDLPALVGVVIHRSPWYSSDIAGIYHRPGQIRVREPYSGEILQPSTMYFAPADHHMHFAQDRIVLSRGPKVHFTRPAVDALFASAAESFGQRVVGIVLTGSGRDGADGLVRIKAQGGLSIIQDPNESRDPRMPLTALREDSVDGIVSLEALPALMELLALGLEWDASHMSLDNPGRLMDRSTSSDLV